MTTQACMTADCDREASSKGMCLKHYHAAYVAANPDRRRAWSARYYAANRVRRAAASAKWRAENLDRVREKCAAYYATHPDAIRATSLLRNYGLTPSGYETILSAQGDGCAGCGATSGANGTRLAVDHDHSCCPGAKSCGRCIRGLLCTECNTSLGKLKDDPAILLRLAEYLVRPPWISVDDWERVDAS